MRILHSICTAILLHISHGVANRPDLIPLQPLLESPHVNETKSSLVMVPGPISDIANATVQPSRLTKPRGDEESQCKSTVGDDLWPEHSTWEEVFPEVIGIPVKGNQAHPNYFFEATSVDDVQTAVRFCKEHNIRLSVISSGLDYLGRNDAPNGLLLSTKRLKGVKVLEQFNPSFAGADRVSFEQDPRRANTIKVTKDIHPAVSIGAGVTTYELNEALEQSKLFAVGASDGDVSIAGGWSQGGGYGPLSGSYGLGADQILEYQVVTADGQLRVANSVSNPDLFWALRGGGGSTFGVVVQATVKTFPTPKVAVASWWVNSSSNALPDTIFKAAAQLHTEFPKLSEKGVQGYYFIHKNAMQGLFFMSDKRIAAARNIWLPTLNKLRKTPGIKSPVIDMVAYDTYKEFFDGTFGLKQREQDSDYHPLVSQPRYEKPHSAPNAERWANSQDETPDSILTRSSGITKIDSRLLNESHLSSSHFAKALEYAQSNKPDAIVRGYLIGKRSLRPLNETSVHPSWDRTVTLLVGEEMYPFQLLAPDTGAFLNEASVREPNWKTALWGANYDRLLSVKQAYDPHGFFYVTPGIGADAFHVDASRLCPGPQQQQSDDNEGGSSEMYDEDKEQFSHGKEGYGGDRTVPLHGNPLLAGLPPVGDNQNSASSTKFLSLATPWPEDQAAANSYAQSLQASLRSAWSASASKRLAESLKVIATPTPIPMVSKATQLLSVPTAQLLPEWKPSPSPFGMSPNLFTSVLVET